MRRLLAAVAATALWGCAEKPTGPQVSVVPQEGPRLAVIAQGSTSPLNVRIATWGPIYTGLSSAWQAKQTCAFLPVVSDTNGSNISWDELSVIDWSAFSTAQNTHGGPNFDGGGYIVKLGTGSFQLQLYVKDRFGNSGSASYRGSTTSYNGARCTSVF